MVHNHPSGNPAPSSEDIAITRHLHQAGELLRIGLFDHVVIGGRYVSLADEGLPNSTSQLLWDWLFFNSPNSLQFWAGAGTVPLSPENWLRCGAQPREGSLTPPAGHLTGFVRFPGQCDPFPGRRFSLTQMIRVAEHLASATSRRRAEGERDGNEDRK